ncbi:MAG: hypothetical protein GF334_11745 [Candidatus Altiarchaeales archaeon]|nr:hypothetical protein [Candidatus Altiarchaeales archaeon]
MAGTIPVFRSAFKSPEDEFSGRGVRPVVFDILAPDHETSILPDHLKMVLHVNPTSMKMSHTKVIERIHTEGGFVEQHFGDGAENIAFEMASGGFMRLYTGLTNITGGGIEVGGTRRETIAYDKYLDMLALFHNNGHIYDYHGRLVFDGIIKIWFDGHTWYGWFQSFSVTESADSPYQFTLSANFIIDREKVSLRTTILPESSSSSQDPTRKTFEFQEEKEAQSLEQPPEFQYDEALSNESLVEFGETTENVEPSSVESEPEPKSKPKSGETSPGVESDPERDELIEQTEKLINDIEQRSESSFEDIVSNAEQRAAEAYIESQGVDVNNPTPAQRAYLENLGYF